MSKLDLTTLEKAIKTLNGSIESYNRLVDVPDMLDDDINTLKSGVIQNFEVAYEQCWKFMKRWIEVNIDPDSVDGTTKKELFRMAAENKLIVDVEDWFIFHNSRNLTSHTYDQNSAEEVFKISFKFHESAVDFLQRIKARND